MCGVAVREALGSGGLPALPVFAVAAVKGGRLLIRLMSGSVVCALRPSQIVRGAGSRRCRSLPLAVKGGRLLCSSDRQGGWGWACPVQSPGT